ncbi:MAG: exodeoxyribonuclease VII large subunit [Roseovarius sp.]|uniref:exodeoxyribonuclease VII large subunit n=1 Tax=Roseovarius sp. TaxID=1486281 RepID=UPI001B4AA3DC|nr:exodeoxyribonuclease VII large subunit [Roseovarius sp.]MBQ0750325.1 exodeoxyribonuclease VII large subunit [Roseovarius sp.]MBQ0810478.1 exodeoxyribonuclease VII large subunit [Roseovarius sp.]
MSDLIDDPEEGGNAPEFSVSDLSGAIKRMIEGEFSHVRVRGELGRISRPRSGHIYLDLKDDSAVLAGIIWKGVATRLAVQPEEGMEVVATGRLTTFPGQSRYQIIIEDMKPAGMGALMAMLEKRKAALVAEGLFAPERKQALPYLPEIIGVVTSPSGAVIRDILHRLRDRFPRKVLIWPVAVQGDKCAGEVARAIRGFNAMTPGGALPRPDLIIVARGGGSVEDLWGFNEEIVVRAAAESAIPLISAVGHETDTTLIDYASDKRAPTPTAAAELAVPVRMDLLAWVEGQGARLSHALSQGVSLRGQRLRDLARALPRAEVLLDAPRQRLDALGERLPAALIRSVQVRRVHLSETAGALRPALLRRAVEGDRRRLQATAARLNVHALNRDIAQKRRDLDRVSARFSDAAGRQVQGWQDRLAALDRLRETLGYKATLKRGYAVVRGDGAVVTTRAAAAGAAALVIEFADGMLDLSGAGPAVPATKVKPKTPPEGQGTLF